MQANSWAQGLCITIVHGMAFGLRSTLTGQNGSTFLGGEPGRNAYTHPMHDVRSLQMGLRGAVGERFGKGEGVTAISNVTPLFRAIGDHLKNGNIDAARASLLYYTFVFLNLSCVGWRTGTSHLNNGVRFRAAAQDVRQRRR